MPPDALAGAARAKGGRQRDCAESVSSNSNATASMMGEKAADQIREWV
jgi:hypothetical protein